MVVNALLPLQVLAAFKERMQHHESPLVACLSAMVGSIGDNRLGGWYSYRMSKAALNMGLRCAAIERGRGATPVKVLGVHPGTTVTNLSAPFLGKRRARSPMDSARQILEMLDQSGPSIPTGSLVNWDGRILPF